LNILDIIKKKLNTEELYKALPFLNKLKDNERSELDVFFIDKVKKYSQYTAIIAMIFKKSLKMVCILFIMLWINF